MIWLFRVLGRLPLSLNHRIGFAIGWLAWWLSPRRRRLTRENIDQYAKHTNLPDTKSLLRCAIAEQGRGVSELAVPQTVMPSDSAVAGEPSARTNSTPAINPRPTERQTTLNFEL